MQDAPDDVILNVSVATSPQILAALTAFHLLQAIFTAASPSPTIAALLSRRSLWSLPPP
jgi:hypothetical protein